MRISTPQMFQQRVTAILDQQSAINKTQLQLANGKRILAAADDPAGSLRNLQLGDQLAQTERFQKNLDSVKSRLTLEEGTLSSGVDVLQRVRELAIQAINGSLGPADLKAITAEVRGNLEGLLQIANTQDANGESLFAGYQGAVPAFTSDGSGNFTYHGDQGQRYLQVSPTRQIAINDPGAGVFLGVPVTGGGMTSTFDILDDFARSLEAGVPTPDTISDIDAAMEKIQATRSEVGSRLRAVEDQRGINESFSLILQQSRSELTDLDYAEAVSRFNQQLLALQASQEMFSRIQGMSLFDYLG
jgi:flagellar hook-associated protein 3 FlgL